MFAKVFGQIFDSSIASDYNCRRMFMDLLVLADSDGVVDMTYDAISRRTNVPIEEVEKHIDGLCQPDPLSRSKLHEGKRIIPVDAERGWGWQIVNYGHYRSIRDEEARRSYFRSAQRKYRAKHKAVKDKVLTGVDRSDEVQPPASASSSVSARKKGESERDSFDAFWSAYPNKQSKQKALAHFRKLKTSEIPRVMDGLRRWCDSKEWEKENGQFIPHPSTFLHQRRWEDLPNGSQPSTDNDAEISAARERVDAIRKRVLCEKT